MTRFLWIKPEAFFKSANISNSGIFHDLKEKSFIIKSIRRKRNKILKCQNFLIVLNFGKFNV